MYGNPVIGRELRNFLVSAIIARAFRFSISRTPRNQKRGFRRQAQRSPSAIAASRVSYEIGRFFQLLSYAAKRCFCTI